MRYEIAPCTGCEKKMPLINRKHRLCQTCNTNRLHPEGKTKTAIKGKSDKQKDIDAELHRVYAEIALEREHRCTGCGTTRHLSHSHLVPRSQRRDLVTNKDNITYHCLGSYNTLSCHDLWEHNKEGVEEMLDYKQNMEMVYQLDKKAYYNRGGK